MKTYRITIKGTDYEVVVGDLDVNPVTVTVDGETFEVDLPQSDQPSASVASRPAATPTPRRSSPAASTPRPAVPASADDGSIRALMPGRIISVSVSEGQTVTAGQAVLVMESMKMENTISATKDGTVKAVLVGEGDSVQHGQTLVEIDVS